MFNDDKFAIRIIERKVYERKSGRNLCPIYKCSSNIHFFGFSFGTVIEFDNNPQNTGEDSDRVVIGACDVMRGMSIYHKIEKANVVNFYIFTPANSKPKNSDYGSIISNISNNKTTTRSSFPCAKSRKKTT